MYHCGVFGKRKDWQTTKYMVIDLAAGTIGCQGSVRGVACKMPLVTSYLPHKE